MSQIMGVIVIYGLDILKSLFTPTKGFDMSDNAKFIQYQKADAQPVDNRLNILKLGKACWTWLANHNDVKGRSWCREMMSKEMLEEIDECFVKHFGSNPDYHFLAVEDSWTAPLDEYIDEVAKIFDAYITERTWEDPDEKLVRDHLDRKREWMFLDHNNHYSIVLPIMTVSTISSLAVTLARVPLAIQEVSISQNLVHMRG